MGLFNVRFYNPRIGTLFEQHRASFSVFRMDPIGCNFCERNQYKAPGGDVRVRYLQVFVLDDFPVEKQEVYVEGSRSPRYVAFPAKAVFNGLCLPEQFASR